MGAIVDDFEHKALAQEYEKDTHEGGTSMSAETRMDEYIAHARKATHAIETQVRYDMGHISTHLDKTMPHMLLNTTEVVEIYNPAAVEKPMGFRAGGSLDVSAQDVDGRALNFYDQELLDVGVRKSLCTVFRHSAQRTI